MILGIKNLDKYADIIHPRLTKHIIITGFLGGSKTFIMMYLIVYTRSKGLTIITIAMIVHNVIQLSS